MLPSRMITDYRNEAFSLVKCIGDARPLIAMFQLNSEIAEAWGGQTNGQTNTVQCLMQPIREGYTIIIIYSIYTDPKSTR